MLPILFIHGHTLVSLDRLSFKEMSSSRNDGTDCARQRQVEKFAAFDIDQSLESKINRRHDRRIDDSSSGGLQREILREKRILFLLFNFQFFCQSALHFYSSVNSIFKRESSLLHFFGVDDSLILI